MGFGQTKQQVGLNCLPRNSVHDGRGIIERKLSTRGCGSLGLSKRYTAGELSLGGAQTIVNETV